jgi:hypothetical protein
MTLRLGLASVAAAGVALGGALPAAARFDFNDLASACR